MTDHQLSNTMTVVGLVNGMIGGIILILPILALKTGSLLIAPTTFITAFFSYFSCLLLLRHLTNFKDLDEAVYHHFGRRRSFRNFYDIVMIIGLSILLILYFDLICKQWEGMTEISSLIPILNAIVLFPIIYILKKYHFGATLLAYGILSIVGYCIFLLWMWVSAKDGNKSVPLAEKDFVKLGAALAQGFAIQTFFIPILKQNPNKHHYGRLLLITYIIGAGVYVFIGYCGAYSLVNRQKPKGYEPETIGDYFNQKQIEMVVMQIIYLAHLYSAFPQFLLIAKKRFFSMFEWPETKDVDYKDILYAGATILICLILQLTNFSSQILIELNGSIVSFVFVYIIPLGLHIKCTYFPKSFPPLPKSHQIHSIKNLDENQPSEKEEELQFDSEKCCGCDTKFNSKFHEYCEMFAMMLMFFVGVFIMVYTIKLVTSDIYLQKL